MEAPVNGVPDRAVKVRPSTGANYDPTIDVAFICTGNICRSPMAEVLLRARLATLAPEVRIGSAGLLFDGRAAEPHAIEAMAARGIDLRTHASRTISYELLEGTSVIIGMERRHVREVATLGPGLFGRAFTLPELVEAARADGGRPADEAVWQWVDRLGEGRTAAAYLRAKAPEIADPMGRSLGAFEECAERIDEQLAELVALTWPQAPTSTPSGPAAAPATTGGIHADRDRR